MKTILCFFTLLVSSFAMAHPMPNSLILLNIQEDQIGIVLQLPVQEFELAYGKNLESLDGWQLKAQRNDFERYVLSHLKLHTPKGELWPITLQDIKLDSVPSPLNGVYKELIVELTTKRMSGENARNFTLAYDAIIHQVVTHFALVKINQDFNNGIVGTEPVEIGIIQLDIASNTVKPLTITLNEGSRWSGFQKMVALGMHHIRTGIDHLLFLLVILLVAPLAYSKQKWLGFAGNKATAVKILKTVTAFTLGHSATLLLVSCFPLPDFSQSIEIAVAFTILVSAIHSIKPIFPQREVFVTFLFGLIHGSAFASSLYDLKLQTSLKLLSVFGFNLGIELMQLIIVLAFLPVLYLSRFYFYRHLRILGASLALICSVAWIAERITLHENFVTQLLNQLI